MQQSHLILNSSTHPAETTVGDLAHARVTCASLVHVDSQRGRTTPPDTDYIRVHPARLFEVFSRLYASPFPSVVVVAAPAVPVVLQFLHEHPGTVDDFGSVTCTATPDKASQQTAVDTLVVLARIGSNALRPGVAFVDQPDGTPVEKSFEHLVAYLQTGSFTRVSLAAVLPRTTAFDRARVLQLPVAQILRGAVNFEQMLRQAHETGEAESVKVELARKLLVKRALVGCRDQADRLLDELGIPRSSVPQRSEVDTNAVIQKAERPALEDETDATRTTETGEITRAADSVAVAA
jgi:hypothetical protein